MSEERIDKTGWRRKDGWSEGMAIVGLSVTIYARCTTTERGNTEIEVDTTGRGLRSEYIRRWLR